MMIVDAQVHIWAKDTLSRPWPPGRGEPDMPQPLTKDRLLRRMNEAGVQRAVLVPPSWDGERNDVVLDAARSNPDRFTVMGRLDLDDPDARSQLQGWRSIAGMSGLRLTFRKHAMTRDHWIWAASERGAVPLSLGVYGDYAEQFRTLARIAGAHPALRVSICHVGIQKGRSGETAFADLDHVLALARHPNVCVNVTALPCYATDDYPYRQAHPHIRRIYDAFGPARMFWGTDLSRLPCSYDEAIAMFTQALHWLTPEDKRLIMGASLLRWLDWGTAPDEVQRGQAT